MRAVIVETRGGRAAALGLDGVVYLIDAKGRSVGQHVSIGARRGRKWKKPLTWAACVAVLCAMATTGVYAAYEPYAYVGIDADSSIEYTLNRFDQVLDVRAGDDASDALADELAREVKRFTHIDTALDHTVETLYEDGYLRGTDDDLMRISVSAKGKDKAGVLKEHIGERMSGEWRDGKRRPPAEIVPVSHEERRRAPKPAE